MDNIDIQIGERLKKTRYLLGFDKAVAFSEKLGLENQTYGRYEKGERGLPDKIKFQLHEMGVNISWLVTGQGDPFLNIPNKKIPIIEEIQNIIEETVEPKFEEMEAKLKSLEKQLKNQKKYDNTSYTSDPEPTYGEEEAEDFRKVPYVRDIAAGPPIHQSADQSELLAIPAWLAKEGGRYYVASIRGTSMSEADIKDGDMVLIRCTDIPRNNGIQVVRYQGKSTLKRLRETEGKGWELLYEDGTSRVIQVDSTDYEVQGDFVIVLPKNAVRTIV